jgi:flavin-dependent dehydrogenase
LEAAEYDLIVAGAGPAGSACAITAARAGVRVLLLEKDRFPRHKVCGEFVSSESLELLRELVGERNLPSQTQVNSARVFLDGKCLAFPIAPEAQSIPRFDMDAALFRAAQLAGVVALAETPVLTVGHGHSFSVATPTNRFFSRAVVNTTGRWSKLTQFEVAGQEKWLGLKAHFAEPSPPSSVDLYFFPGGYCGVTPVEQNSINACAMVRADVARSLDEVFALNPELQRRSRTWQPLFATVTTSPLYFREPETESQGMLLAGDSAGFIDPFAGDGISLALQSGVLAANTIVPFLDHKYSWEHALREYRSAYIRRFVPAFRNAARLRNAFAAPRWARNAAFALARMPGVGRMLMSRTRARS